MITTENYVISKLPKRHPDSNKGTYGKTLLICGNADMRGAAALATLGALRLGVGLVTLASVKEVIDSLSSAIYEPVFCDRKSTDISPMSERMTSVGVGPGMGGDAKEYVQKLILSYGCPLIIDADGINALAENPSLLKKAKRQIILTPHPLEFSRLSGLSVSEIQSDRERAAREFAAEYNVTLLLKGHGTVITDGDKVFVNPTGGSALAKGGSGDVLFGMICALVAEGCTPLDSCVISAYLHGLAGERLANVYSEYGVMPSEIPAEAAKVLKEFFI